MTMATKGTEPGRLEDEVYRLRSELGHRERQLDCLHRMSELASDSDTSAGELLQRAARTIPLSWQYPVDAWARITYGDEVFATANVPETPWRQAEQIMGEDGVVGCVEVFYIERKPDMA